MHEMNLYEKKIIADHEFPVQIFEQRIHDSCTYCPEHWHEHLEMQFILEGEGIIYSNYKAVPVHKGNLVIINSNELHKADSIKDNLSAIVLIFELNNFTNEAVNQNMIFQTLVGTDEKIEELFFNMNRENKEQNIGYKLALKGGIFELLTHLMRNYIARSISNKEHIIRSKNLVRLNTVFQYIQNNYTEPISNSELAALVHLSEYRFCHLFKESMGQSPLQFINDIRLKKAYHLLQQKELTVSEIAAVVGFQDYNNFGRLFRKKYGLPPSKVWESDTGKFVTHE